MNSNTVVWTVTPTGPMLVTIMPGGRTVTEPVFTCAIVGHEHENQEEAAECIAWLDENWDQIKETSLPVRAEWRKIRRV
jgi:hypothetical protein